MALPWGELWTKGIRIGMGQTPVKQIHYYLRNLIMADKAKPSFIVTDHIRIQDAPRTYEAFDKRDVPIKAVIRFDGRR